MHRHGLLQKSFAEGAYSRSATKRVRCEARAEFEMSMPKSETELIFAFESQNVAIVVLQCSWGRIDPLGKCEACWAGRRLPGAAPGARASRGPGTALTQNTMDARWGNISRVQPCPITNYYVRSANKLLPRSKKSIS